MQCTIEQPKYPCMTQLTTRGSFYDVGYNVGFAYADHIKKFFKGCQTEMIDFYESPKGREFYGKSLAVCEASYPQYVRELRGIADGSGMPFEHIFISNVYEYPLTEEEPAQSKGDGMGCTGLFVIDKSGHQYVVHNEDMWPESKQGYLLTADIEEEGFPSESFTAFCYPGFLPNWAFGFNQHGLTFNINAIHPDKNMLSVAPGMKFVLRSVIRARNVDEVVELAKNAPHGVGYGCVINVTTKDGQMTSIEVAPGKPESKLHVYHVAEKGKPLPSPSHYFHFNLYKHLKVDEKHHGAWKSSEHRLATTDKLPPPHDLKTALVTMADNSDPVWPVFRKAGKVDLMETVATALYDVTDRKFHFFQGREDLLANKPLITLPLP